MSELKTVTEEGCPEERAYCSDFDPSGKKCKYYDVCQPKHELCGYSNCFRPFYRMRGFMPTCEFHYKNPLKWGKDGCTYTGSVWRKKDSPVSTKEVTKK